MTSFLHRDITATNVSKKLNAQNVRVQISDNGIGVRKEDLGKIFEPFATIEKKSYIPGTGLGLSVAKGLVESHKGKIWVESPGEDKGSTFIFTLLTKMEYDGLF